MLEMLEKALLTGLGAVALSQKKVEELAAELKDKYKVSEEEGKAFLEKVQNMARESRARLQEAAEEEVKKALERLGAVPRDEFDRLKKRVDELENRKGGNEPGEPC